MMTATMMLFSIPRHIKIVCAHKYYILYLDKLKKRLSLYDTYREKIIWRSEILEGWNLEFGEFLVVKKKTLKIAAIYRANTIVSS